MSLLTKRWNTRYLLRTLLFLLICKNSFASDPQHSGLVYGKNHAYFLTPPTGWVLDNSSGVSQGLHAVFYPEGSTWKNASVVMYTNWANKDSVISGIRPLVDFNLDNLIKKGSKNINAVFVDSIKTLKEKTGEIWKFYGDQWGNFEEVAYFDEPTGIVIIVLSSKFKRDFDASVSAFRELLKSYLFMNISTKNYETIH